MQTVGEIGEFGLIEAIADRLGTPPVGGRVLLGPGDDAAVLAVPNGRSLVTTDLLVEGRHFRRDWSSAYDVGRKAAAQNLADVAAMGGAPTAIVVGLGTPPDLPVDWALDLASGLRDECDRAGAAHVGGDIVGSPYVVVSVTALGEVGVAGQVLTRDGARPGDVVAVCGRLGWSAAGQLVLERGLGSHQEVVDAHRRPEPAYDAGPEALTLGATAFLDVSDGLLADLGHVARASGVGIDVESARLAVPEPLRAVAAAVGVDPLGFVLGGGEDHALVGTFPADTVLGERWQTIGRVTELAAGEEATVTVDGAAYAGSAGHDHFR